MMAPGFEVDYLEEPGRGMVYLKGEPPGPAGEARLRLTEEISCWFDPSLPAAITDCWLDLDTIGDPELVTAFGPGALGLRAGEGIERFELDRPARWMELAARLALLEQTRASPLGARASGVWSAPAGAGAPWSNQQWSQALWSVEALVLRDALEQEGLGLASEIQREAAAAVPVLLGLGLPGLAVDSLPARALWIALDRHDLSPGDRRELEPLVRHLDRSTDRDLDRLFAQIQAMAEPYRISTMGTRGSASTHDQVWSNLPPELFPGGVFTGTVVVELGRQRHPRRLRIRMDRPAGASRVLFVRLVNPSGSEPIVIAIDAMKAEDDHYTTEMDAPRGFDLEATRAEVVADLGLPLLPDSAYLTCLGHQSGQIALGRERAGDNAEASRQWRLAERFHTTAGRAAQAARARSRASHNEPSSSTPFWAESEQARNITPADSPSIPGERS